MNGSVKNGAKAFSGSVVAGPLSSATTLPENAFAPFFTEPFTGALYSQEQIGERWMNMSEEQQAQVRAECDTFAKAGLPDDEVITGSIEDSTVYEASVSQLCDMVGAM